MVAPASYGWNLSLTEAVGNGETVDVPAHDINDNVDQESVELAVDGDVIPKDEFSVVFNVAAQLVTVTNLTGSDWDEQSNVYVSAQRKGLTGGAAGSIEEHFSDLEDEVGALEDRVTTLEDRVTALEGAPASRQR